MYTCVRKRQNKRDIKVCTIVHVCMSKSVCMFVPAFLHVLYVWMCGTCVYTSSQKLVCECVCVCVWVCLSANVCMFVCVVSNRISSPGIVLEDYVLYVRISIWLSRIQQNL